VSISTAALRTVSPHFQRSINLEYDTKDSEYIAGYIPTQNGADALATILNNSLIRGRQRAHLLHAAYGSGKSLLGLVLSALADDDDTHREALALVEGRLKRAFPEQAKHVHAYNANHTRLLPVILSGDEGHFATALQRALSRTLIQHSFEDIQLNTQFHTALEIIDRWKKHYPDAYQHLQTKLSADNSSLPKLVHGLEGMQPKALILFERLYPEVTSGAYFDRYSGTKLENLFLAAAEALHSKGYNGLLVIWDEFGRFLDTRVGKAFGPEAALLQSFAEFCNRSGNHQVHLVLIAHQLLSNYAAGLPTTYQQEWARIAERFYIHDVSSEPSITYRLITEALNTPEPQLWTDFADRYHQHFDRLTAYSLELGLFEELDDVALRQQVIERTWPLHPLTVYALPRIAGRVAQNERTLFTFLAAEEPGTLIEQLKDHKDENSWWLIELDALWDYFADAIQYDTRPGGTHTIWMGVMYALSKLASDDLISRSLIKSLGILLIVSDVNVQSQTYVGRAIPTTQVLAWAVGASDEEVAVCLEQLSRRRAVVFRKSDGYWTFTRGSDVDLDKALQAVLERHTPTKLQMRQLLEYNLPLAFHLPRSYNQERGIIRFFHGLYRWSDEMKDVCSEDFFKQLGPQGYADGAIIYVLATTSVEREEAINIVHSLPSSRSIYIIPDQPLLILEPILEIFALRDLGSDATFLQRDERLQDEIAFFIEDAQRRLTRALRPLTDLNQLSATWWWCENDSWNSGYMRYSDGSRLLSKLCNQQFDKTPRLNNELLNQYAPSQQQVHAAEKVIDALLSNSPEQLPQDLNLSGHGPDWLILRTLFVQTGLMEKVDSNNWELHKPVHDPLLTLVWDTVQKFLDESTENEQEVGALIDQLQSPPFGLRRGVLPLLLATMMRHRLPVLTIRQSRKIVSPINGQVFTALCKQPESYTIEVGPWDTRHIALWDAVQECIHHFLTEQEKNQQQPFNTLSSGLLRWLQSQPRYCRDTKRISSLAQRFRELIREGQRDPFRVLCYDLLELLDENNTSGLEGEKYKQLLVDKISGLMDEIATSYQALLYSLDRFVEGAFVTDVTNVAKGFHQYAPGRPTILNFWLDSLEQRSEINLSTFRFSDQLAQGLVQVIRKELTHIDAPIWQLLSKTVLGIALHDWNDRSEEIFKHNLLDIKERVEREILTLAKDEAAVRLSISMPDQGEQIYRFRPSQLSDQGQRILQSFQSTLEISGRPLSTDERRQIVLALLHSVLNESSHEDEHGAGKHKRH
jgi:hypothetical protein